MKTQDYAPARHRILSADEEKVLAARIMRGDIAARNELTLLNQRLVCKVARSYIGAGLDYEDLVSEGNIGLMEAAWRFDGRGKFSSYARWWIRHSINTALTEIGRTIRLARRTFDLTYAYAKAAARMRLETGHDPDFDSVCRELGLVETDVELVRLGLNARRTISFNEKFSPSEDESELLAILADQSFEEDQAGELSAKDELARLRNAVSALSEPHRHVIRHRFAIEGAEWKTLKQIGDEMGRTREWVRILETQGVCMLRQMLETR